MAAKFSKYPPKFHIGRDYKAWKNKTNIWLGMNESLPKKDQAPTIRMYCFEEHPIAESVVEQLTSEELIADDGLVKIFAKLDQNFLEDAIDEMFGSFRDVFEYKKPKQITVADYIIAFEQKWDKMASGCAKPVVTPELKGSFLLYNANLSQNDRKIVLSAVKSLDYVDVRSTLKRVFNKQNPGGGGQSDVIENTESEEAFYTNKRNYDKYSSRPPIYTDTRRFVSSSKGHNSRQYSDYGNSASSSKYGKTKPQIKSQVKKMNPLQRDG